MKSPFLAFLDIGPPMDYYSTPETSSRKPIYMVLSLLVTGHVIELLIPKMSITSFFFLLIHPSLLLTITKSLPMGLRAIPDRFNPLRMQSIVLSDYSKDPTGRFILQMTKPAPSLE